MSVNTPFDQFFLDQVEDTKPVSLNTIIDSLKVILETDYPSMPDSYKGILEELTTQLQAPTKDLSFYQHLIISIRQLIRELIIKSGEEDPRIFEIIKQFLKFFISNEEYYLAAYALDEFIGFNFTHAHWIRDLITMAENKQLYSQEFQLYQLAKSRSYQFIIEDTYIFLVHLEVFIVGRIHDFLKATEGIDLTRFLEEVEIIRIAIDFYRNDLVDNFKQFSTSVGRTNSRYFSSIFEFVTRLIKTTFIFRQDIAELSNTDERARFLFNIISNYQNYTTDDIVEHTDNILRCLGIDINGFRKTSIEQDGKQKETKKKGGGKANLRF